MNTFDLINKIYKATSIKDVFSQDKFLEHYKKSLGMLHPDICKLDGARDAFVKLIQLKSEYEKGKIIQDDAGNFSIEKQVAFYKGDMGLLTKSYDNYQLLKEKRDETSVSFHKYIPDAMGITTNLQVMFKDSTFSTSRLVLPQKHVLWILSRLLEATAWFSEIGYVHGGINPESVFIVPETHGIIIGSFYHFTKENTKLKTISAKYKHWYPKEIFDRKRAVTSTDLELIKRTAAYLLGDPSGIGIKLRKTHHPAVIEFLLKKHKNAYECYDDYRTMLKSNFEVKYHELVL